MQTFLPYPNFSQSAKCLDNKRLGKQRVECLQILQVLSKERTEVVQRPNNQGIVVAVIRNTPWYNHPAVKMWRGYSECLVHYSDAICNEWHFNRGFDDNCLTKIYAMFGGHIIMTPHRPPWLGNEAFHASHRSNLLRKDFAHYSQFGWTEPNNLPYVWPV